MHSYHHMIPNRHNLELSVIVETPESPQGLVFILHGFLSSGSAPTPVAFAETALGNNLTSVRFDASHALGRSDGDPARATITSFRDDLEDVVGWARTQPWFVKPYLLVGSSLGGIALLEHAHKYRDETAGLALLAPVISGALSAQAYEKLRNEEYEAWRKTGFTTRQAGGKTVTIPWSHMEDRMQYDALAYAPDMPMPLMIVVGSEDKSCPVDGQEQLFRAWGAAAKHLCIINGAPHGFSAHPDYMRVLQDHFDRWLKQPA